MKHWMKVVVIALALVAYSLGCDSGTSDEGEQSPPEDTRSAVGDTENPPTDTLEPPTDTLEPPTDTAEPPDGLGLDVPDVCEPDCEDKECGDDGCGGNCGDCGAGMTCDEGGCIDGPILYVDNANTEDPLEDGTEDHPFDEIQEALDVAGPDALVWVAPGDNYDVNDGLVVHSNGLTLQAEVPGTVFMAVPWGDPVILVDGVNDVSLVDLNLGGGEPTIAFLGEEGDPISGCALEGITVEWVGNVMVPGLDSVAIQISDCDGVVIEDVEINKVLGGQAEDYSLDGDDIEQLPGWASVYGGEATGIQLSRCTDVLLSDVGIHEVKGGQGGTVTTWYIESGPIVESYPGGSGVGISNDQVVGLTIDGLLVENIEGAEGGDAAGVWIVDCPATDVMSCTIANVHAISSSAQKATGIAVEGFGSDVEVRNSIIADTGKHCLSADATANLVIAYTDLYSCGQSAVLGTTSEPTCIAQDPMFDSTYHLQPSSPCIDAGDPAAVYSLEVEPNGCCVNMGAWGNTDESASAADASHCD